MEMMIYIMKEHSNATKSDFNFLFYNLALLISSGISILKALEVLDESAPRRVKGIISELYKGIREGGSLSKEIGKLSGDDFFFSIIRTGEEAGNIEKVLFKLSSYLDEKSEYRKKVIKALTYPLILLITTILISLFICFFLLPSLAELLDNGNNTLPPLTRGILQMVSYIKDNTMSILYDTFILTTIFIVLFKLIGSYINIFTIIKGKTIFKLWEINMIKTLHLLIESGSTIQSSILLLIRNEKNSEGLKVLSRVQNRVLEGFELSRALKEEKNINSSVSTLISLGEECGNLEKYLKLCYSLLEKSYYERLNKAITLFQPILLAAMGFIIITLIYSIFMPLMAGMYSL